MELQERRMVLRDAEQSRLQDSSRVWTSRKSTIPCGTWRAKNTLTLTKLKLNRAINASFSSSARLIIQKISDIQR